MGSLLLASSFMRQATAEDADDIARLDMQLFPDNCFNERTVGNELEAGISWVIHKGGELIGYALVRPDGDIVDLIRIGVSPDHQRKGWGLKLLKLVSGCNLRSKVMLTVRKDNHGAIKLYLWAGFKIIGHLEAYEKKSWVMLLTSWLI